MIREEIPPYDVLLIEDEPSDAHLVKVAIHEAKVWCRLHHVIDGVEAMCFLRRQGRDYAQVPRPDLILLDLNMPRMNGREFLASIKADDLFAAIPVVVLSTSEVERDVIASYKLGAASYITKPLDIEQFIETARRLSGYWFSLTRLPQKDGL